MKALENGLLAQLHKQGIHLSAAEILKGLPDISVEVFTAILGIGCSAAADHLLFGFRFPCLFASTNCFRCCNLADDPNNELLQLVHTMCWERAPHEVG